MPIGLFSASRNQAPNCRVSPRITPVCGVANVRAVGAKSDEPGFCGSPQCEKPTIIAEASVNRASTMDDMIRWLRPAGNRDLVTDRARECAESADPASRLQKHAPEQKAYVRPLRAIPESFRLSGSSYAVSLHHTIYPKPPPPDVPATPRAAFAPARSTAFDAGPASQSASNFRVHIQKGCDTPNINFIAFAAERQDPPLADPSHMSRFVLSIRRQTILAKIMGG